MINIRVMPDNKNNPFFRVQQTGASERINASVISDNKNNNLFFVCSKQEKAKGSMGQGSAQRQVQR